MSLSVDGVWKAGVWATTVWHAGVWREGAPTPPSPVVSTVSVSGGAGRRIFGPIDWSRFDRVKKRAKKKSKKAVEIVEEITDENISLSAALERLEQELVAARIVQLEVYRDLLRLELERKADDDEDDELLLMR